MSKKKPAIIRVKKTRHKSNPYVFEIDTVGPSPKDTNKERYSRPWSAARAALGKLDARTSMGFSGRAHRYSGGFAWFTPKGNPIEIVYVTGNKKKA